MRSTKRYFSELLLSDKLGFDAIAVNEHDNIYLQHDACA